MPASFNLHIPSLTIDSIESTARECAAIWRRFQEGMPAFAELAQADTKLIEQFARAQKGKWEHVVVLGMGGSSLGAKAVIDAAQTRRAPVFHFLDTVDPLELADLFKNIRLRKTLFLVVSKSGGTLETLANFFVIREKLGKSWRKQIVVITDPKVGYLRKLAEKEELPSFEIPENVGGRYSVLSSCGLLPAALAGIKIRELLAGAREVQASEAFHFALVHAELFTQKRNITVTCPYSNKLKTIGDWYGQLLAESIGKHEKIGITPESAVGPADQHSKLQLWAEGPDDKFYLFFGVEQLAKDFQLPSKLPAEFAYIKSKSLQTILAAELTGTVGALQEAGRPLALFDVPDLSPRSIGWLLQFFMLEVAFLGEILGVDPYNQPGVERGKVIAKELLMKKKN